MASGGTPAYRAPEEAKSRGAVLRVTGAGSTICNGYYKSIGDGERSFYQHVSTRLECFCHKCSRSRLLGQESTRPYIMWQSDGFGEGHWSMRGCIGNGEEYRHILDTTTPPTSGWEVRPELVSSGSPGDHYYEVYHKPQPPAPTVTML